MTTLPPLIESSSSERARELLRAARADGPRAGAAQRTLTALGVTAASATTAGAALGAGAAQVSTAASLASTAGSLPLLAAKWLVVGTLGGLLLASGAHLALTSHPSGSKPPAAAAASPGERAPSSSAAIVPAPPETLAQPAAPELASEPASSKPSRSGATASAKVEVERAPRTAPSQAEFAAPEQSKLLHDIALLDDARRALKAGDGAAALARVARYEAERQTHVLDREAELLRERALGSSK